MGAGGKAQLKEASMLFIARRVLAVILLVFAWTAIAWAQAYPDRPLRLVVGFPPGGSGDFLVRIIVCVTPQRGIGSMKELIAKVKSEPGKWFYASPGNGTSQHLAGAELNRLAGTDMQHVPFKGGAPSLQAVLAGDVQVMIGTTPVVLPQIRAGKLVPLALITRAASPMVPGVPGMEEAGVPGLDLGSWWGIWAPPGVRPEVKQRLYTSITRVMRLPQVAQKLAREAMEPEVSASPEEFAAFVRRDHASYEAIVKSSGAKAE